MAIGPRADTFMKDLMRKPKGMTSSTDIFRNKVKKIKRSQIGRGHLGSKLSSRLSLHLGKMGR